MAANKKRSYEDFEPLCKWHREQGRDVLEIHLQGFRKENLKVQVNSCGILTISGEQPIGTGNINRFRKEINVSKSVNPAQIRAKFALGILYITLPTDSSEAKSRQTISSVGDDMFRVEMSKKMAVSIAVVIAVGIVVGGFLIAWKCSKVPAPIIH